MKENFGNFIWPIFTYFKNYSDNKSKNMEIKNKNNYNHNEPKINNRNQQFIKQNLNNIEIENRTLTVRG